MSFNRIVEVKQGEVGFVVAVKLYDATKALIDLSFGGNWTVTMKVTNQGETTTIIGPRTMLLSNQSTNRGEATYALVANDFLIGGTGTTPIAPGSYDLEIKAVETNNRVHFFPKSNENATIFGVFKMLASKG